MVFLDLETLLNFISHFALKTALEQKKNSEGKKQKTKAFCFVMNIISRAYSLKCIFKVKKWKRRSLMEPFRLGGCKTNISVETRRLRPAITTPDLLVMRYKMPPCIPSVFPCLSFSPPRAHLPSFIYPLIIQISLPSSSARYLFFPLASPRTLSFLPSSFHLLPIPPTFPLPSSLSPAFEHFS